MATRVSHLPPVGSLFAAFLGYNPMQTLLGPATLSHLPHATAAYLTSHQFFPHLISPAFSDGLTEAFAFAAAVCILGAFASMLRGGKYHYVEPGSTPSTTGPRRRGSMTVCPPRRRWPRPSRCWWTDMPVTDETKNADPATDDRRGRHPHQRRRHAGGRLGAHAALLRGARAAHTVALHRRRRAPLHPRRPRPPRAHPGAARGPRHEPRRDPRVPQPRDPPR